MNQNNNYQESQDKTVQNSVGTQTDNAIFQSANIPHSLVTQFLQLKLRQDQVEQQMKAMQEKMESQKHLDTLTPTEFGNMNCYNLRSEITTQPTGELVRQPHTKLQNEELSGIIKALENTGPKISHPVNSIVKPNVGNKKRKNTYSVSMQVARGKAQHTMNTTAEQKLSSNQNVELIQTGLKLCKTPPSTAIPTDTNESVEEFFSKHIEHYKIINTKILTPFDKNFHENNPTDQNTNEHVDEQLSTDHTKNSPEENISFLEQGQLERKLK
ncbi:hypothetical protein J6590_037105 [Homalodisca vitripennis]|nr:hypothetical protein J6590_037105 [Homalodisca vitripennis]